MRLRGIPLKLVMSLGPSLYLTYIRFVFLTSSKTFYGFEPLWDRLDRGQNVLGAVRHEDALIGPYAFRDRHTVTMASLSRGGEFMSQALSRWGYTVFRGSNAGHAKEALKEMVEYIKPRTARFGVIAVDPLREPTTTPRKAIVVLAKHTGAPIFPIRCGAKRRILNRNWAKIAIPFPFNELVYCCGDPVWVDRSAGRDEIEAARIAVGKQLNELTERVEHYFNRTVEHEEDSAAAE